MTASGWTTDAEKQISTPMPLAGHDSPLIFNVLGDIISTPMPLAGHDANHPGMMHPNHISTPMPLAGHDSYI